jgi:hypothetical protein
MAIVTRTSGAAVMAEYRAYIIGSDGHFRDAIVMNCDSDEAARQRADSLAKAEAVDVELWQRARKVATSKRQSVTHEVHDGRLISKPADTNEARGA